MIFLQPDRDDMQLHWRTLMVLGFLLIVAGELALCCVTMGPPSTAGAPLGVVLLSAGAILLYAPVHHAAWAGRGLQIFAATVYIGAGAWLACAPSASGIDVMPVLGACFVAGGALRIRAALEEQRLQWGWLVLSGAVTALLGVLTVAAWPHAGVSGLGEFAALELFVAGTTCLGLAWSGRQIGTCETADGFS